MSNSPQLSNRQRRILEREAEKNRERAAARQATTRTPFREGELLFVARHPPPDYTQALDFRQPPEVLLRNPKIQQRILKKGRISEYSDLFGVDQDPKETPQYAYLHEDHPGLVYIPAAFTPEAQRSLIRACLKDYSKHPNKCSLDTHYLVPESGLWQLHENVFTGKQTLDDPSVYVPKKAKTDDKAQGYGSDDDDNDAPEEGKKSQPSVKAPSVRSLVPIINGTPSVPDDVPKIDPEPSNQVPILPPAQLVRKMRWITLGYQYHWPSKTYHFDQNAPFPEELKTLSKAVVAAIDGVGPYPYAADDFVAEAGVVNYYQLKDRLMGHVDRSELNKDAPLVSFRQPSDSAWPNLY
ncbi:hypothetical protein BGW38_003474 [Lunasporangiospora selenospora]|uniref:Alpha-ketoglutarate-dependent dioxygenase AlkB-like domain-containing protein n=1 Tax=Lunasporangiospora selenospora TaxID=979761 RepID=A0A9P6FRT0_9FUNG|nr:hypothetical protein BGW38_003474 [Lunasporangiospora selenospora]